MPETTAPQSTAKTARAYSQAPASKQWRVVDYVVTAVLGIGVGLIFWVLALSWKVLELGFQAFPPSIGLIAGLWVLAGPLAGAIIRKPGAALLCELIAAIVEAVLGSHFGATVLLSGLVQGLGAELIFAAFGYRKFNLWVTSLAGLLAAAFMSVSENIMYNAEWQFGFQAAYTVCAIISGVVISGIGAWFAYRAIAKTGALSSFASGRLR
ncbi:MULTISPECIES: ECF transporter S component [unclassified Brevibacterium]|uniref:ECF transporter S component n=1 Tax=unclassified Brevibacterium TaxID=2614124 RepID=UPI000C462181|nr:MULTISPECIES: ECF transporter S component [unclassified Brevibacterium]SMX76826.1 energy-coupling factor transport system substrate-specific component [Brevibacterium sp. 239c]